MRHYILEAFDYGECEGVDVDGKTVVDVGASYGETAVYFLKRSAKRVIAIEPCPEAFKEMLENIGLNGVGDRVVPVNAAISSKRGAICVKCPSRRHAVDAIRSGTCEKYDLCGGVLKMDYEGCEYDVVLNDYEHVKLFDEVHFEYHAFMTKKPVEVLLRRLSEDFVYKMVSDEYYCERRLQQEAPWLC